MSKHDAAPWKIVTMFDGSRNIVSEENNYICQFGHESGTDRETTEANGLLLSVAPELLVALQAYVAADEERCGARMPCYDAAVEAIAKAVQS